MQVKKVLTLTWGLPDPSPLLCALHHLGWEAVWVSNASDARQALELLDQAGQRFGLKHRQGPGTRGQGLEARDHMRPGIRIPPIMPPTRR